MEWLLYVFICSRSCHTIHERRTRCRSHLILILIPNTTKASGLGCAQAQNTWAMGQWSGEASAPVSVPIIPELCQPQTLVGFSATAGEMLLWVGLWADPHQLPCPDLSVTTSQHTAVKQVGAMAWMCSSWTDTVTLQHVVWVWSWAAVQWAAPLWDQLKLKDIFSPARIGYRSLVPGNHVLQRIYLLFRHRVVSTVLSQLSQ